MADFNDIIQEINTNLPDNIAQAITAAKLRTTLIDLTDKIEDVQNDFETSINTEVEDFIEQAQEATDNFTATIVDNLTSDDPDKALSANQGKILNESIANKVNVSNKPNLRQYLPATLTTGRYLNSSGKAATSSSINSGGITGFIPVSGLTNTIIFKNVCSTSACVGCATYTEDNENSFVSRYTGSSYPTNSVVTFFMNDARIEAGIAYIRFTLYNVTSLDDIEIYYANSDNTETPIFNYEANNLSEKTTVEGTNLFEYENGVNLFNKSDANLGSGLYLNSTGASAVSGTSTAGYTGFIEFPKSGALWITRRYSTLPTSRYNVIYDENFNVLRTTQSPYVYKNFNSEVEEKYVRFTITETLANVDNFMISEPDYTDYLNEGWTVPEYVENTKVNKDFMSEISVDNIDKTEWKYGSENILDPNECTWNNTLYINTNNGSVSSASASTNKIGVTPFIPIDKQGLYISHQYNNRDAIGAAVYDNNFKFINKFYGNACAWANDGRAYVRWTIGSGATTENIMVNKGTSAKEYVAYAGKTKVISKDILPNFQEGGEASFYDGVTINLPTNIYVSKGDRLQIFWKNVVTAFDPYVFNVFGSCSVGRSYPRYFQLDATSGMVGKTYTMTAYARDNQGNIIARGSTSIKVVDTATSPASSTNILIIGASATASGNIINELDRRITKTSGSGTYADPTGLGLSNINWVGRKQPISSRPDLKQEANSGWAWKDFATVGRYAYRFFINDHPVTQLYEGDVYSGAGTLKFTITEINITDGVGYISATYTGSGTTPASGTLTISSGDGDATIQYDSFNIDSGNPFWNESTSSLDFVTYANTYCNGSIDIMISHLGVNDIFSDRDGTTTVNTYVKPFLNAFHTQFPNAKFIISTLPMCSPFGGMTESYGATVNNQYWTKAKKFWDFGNAFNDLVNLPEYSSWVTLSTPLHTFDSENLYPTKTVNVDNRNTSKTETIQTNGVHPTAIGSYAVADDIFHSLMKVL